MNPLTETFDEGRNRTSSTRIVFDIESGPLPLSHLESIMPEFKAAANLKDPAKIAASIAEKRESFVSDAALDATTGRVLAIGHFIGESYGELHGPDEAALLTGFWNILRSFQSGNQAFELIGFNSNQFDLPFLFQRSIALNVPIPLGLRQGRYWANHVIDLREVWNFGRKEQKGSLDHICRSLGLGQKSGSGADFAKLYETDPEKALAYLKNDCLLTKKLAERIL